MPRSDVKKKSVPFKTPKGDRSGIDVLKKFLLKKLSFGLCKTGGRNFFGCITVFHRGGGVKRRYKLIDYQRRLNAFGVVIKFTADSHRAAFLSLICYFNGLLTYIIGSSGLMPLDVLFSGNNLVYAKDYLNEIVKFEKCRHTELKYP